MNKKTIFCANTYNLTNEIPVTKQGFPYRKNPLQRLPNAYTYWENTADILPKIISLILDEKSPRKINYYYYVINVLEKMPQYEINHLVTKDQRQRAILLLGIFAHTWVWLPYVAGMSEKPEQFIPKQIAVPLYQLSELLTRPPALTNSDLFDYNWKQCVSNEEININNLDILNGFLKNDAEKYFYLTFLVMRLQGEPAIQRMLNIQNKLKNASIINKILLEELKSDLDFIAEALERIRKTLSQVFSTINKEDWFNKVRWFSVGWNNKDMFPNGIVYEGVEVYKNQGQHFYGPSGFQYPVFQCTDAFLSIQHKAYIHQVNSRQYMPSNQVEIINTIEEGPKIRSLLAEYKISEKKFFIDTSTNSYKNAVTAYNNCIRQVKNIRALHFGIASKYLTKMILQELEQELESKMILTTGGTQDDHEHLLKEIIDSHNNKIG